MYLTNVFLGLMSLTNLTIFMNRVINDGQYQSAILIYDYKSIEDTNFIQELSDPRNRNYAIATVCIDNALNQHWMEHLTINEHLLNALHVAMVVDTEWDVKTLLQRHSLYSRDIVFLLPERHRSLNQKMLWIFRSRQGNKNRISVIFYQTPRTIRHRFSNKTIEAFVVNSDVIPANQSVFEIDAQGDIHSQLNGVANLTKKIFDPEKRTLLVFFELGASRNVEIIEGNGKPMTNNKDIFMANFIARHMKNLSIWQLIQQKSGNFLNNVFKYKPSNRPIYAELYVSSVEIYRKEANRKL